MKKQSFVSIVIFAALCLFTNTINFAQTATPTPCVPTNTSAGSYDGCFGYDGTGTVITTVPGVTKTLYVNVAALQSDGKILSLLDAPFDVTSSGFSNIIARYNTNGTIDTNFGNGGFVYMNWFLNGSSGNAYDMAIQQINGEERIVIVGSAPPITSNGSAILRVERYLSNGSPDTSFGTDGSGRIIINAAYPLAVAIQPWDQKILTMGDLSVLVRLNTNGTPDTTFGINGVSQAKSGVSAKSLAVQSNRKILAVGSFRKNNGPSDFAVARLNENGTLDGTFGTSGKVTTDFAKGSDGASDVVVTGSDYIIAGGSAGSNSGSNMAVVRYTPNGQLDTSFGGGSGKASFSVNAGNDGARSLSLQSDNKIVLFGSAIGTGGNRDFAVARFNADGTIDTGFGQGGKVTTDFYGGHDDNYGVIQPNPACACGERIVSVGVARTMTSDGGGYGNSFAAAVGYIR